MPVKRRQDDWVPNGEVCARLESIPYVENVMLRWTLIFLVIALVAGFFGFFGVAGMAASIAKVLFFLFLILLVLSLLGGTKLFGRGGPLP